MPFYLLLLPCKTSILFCSFFWTSIFLFLYSPFPTTFASGAASFYGNETDRLSLLAIKAQIIHDPFGIMNSWNDSVHFCNWVGVTCGRRHQRVTTLNLNSHGLVGSLSAHVGNLTFLKGLNFELNHFHGEIPQQIGRLWRLKYLNLTNNSFSGEIPVNLSACSNLIYLRLGFNNLIGGIPYQLGLLQNLQRVQLHYNNLTGPLPESFGNLSSARSLSVAMNNLEGNIPDTLGHLKNLEFLGLGVNKFSGIVPPSVYNISSMIKLTIPYNQLDGSLPSDIAFTLPNLQVLNVGHCLFSGVLPASLSNATNLIELDANGSNFTGNVAIDFAGTPGLWWLVLASNSLGTGKGDDLNFLNSLTKCKNLHVLDLSDNKFGGVLPNSLSNLSSLVTLRLNANHLTGSIPTGIENLVNLTELTMAKNNLSGRIPATIGKLQMLRKLDMSENELSGHIPSSLATITQLFSLRLEKNNLTGSIPSSLGNLSSLQDLDLSQNSLSGTIPESVMSLSSLTISLNLARNQFTGSLPSEVGVLENLNSLNVSENRLSGEIPSSLGHCLSLEQLRMEGNLFQGTIPPSFSSLKGLQYLDLSRNNLSGQIPEFFQQISFLNLNLSFNHFEGPVPKGGVFGNATAISVAGNKKLCGGVHELYLPACNPNRSKKGKIHGRLKLMILLLSALLGVVLIMSLPLIYCLRKMKREQSAISSSALGLLLNVSYESLLKATDGFSSANSIGSGGFGSVYKGILGPDQLVVAVKVLHLREQGALKTFLSECEVLRNIRHRNLVKVITACSSIDFQGNDFKALVYEFMPNGNLQSWLQPIPQAGDTDGELRMLNLLQRLNIAIDVASALDYLHHHCQIPIVHCDIKPSNILLDNDLTAHVGDFGLAKFIIEASSISPQNQSSSVGLKGTVGYAAPEYGMGSGVSTYGDVYSYGILLLEMFTGKCPTDDMFKDGLDLHSYVKVAIPDHLSEVLDPLFLVGGGGEEDEANSFTEGQSKRDQIEDCLTSILGIGVNCSVETPTKRMVISKAVKELKLIRATLIPLME